MDRIFAVGGTGQHIIGALYHLYTLKELFLEEDGRPNFEILIMDMDTGVEEKKGKPAFADITELMTYYKNKITVNHDISPIPDKCRRDKSLDKFKGTSEIIGLKADLMDVFFNKAQLDTEITKGMFGQSTVGSIIFEEKLDSEESKDREDTNNIFNPTDKSKKDIFIVGSTIGGTGSGVIPALIRKLNKKENINNIFVLPFLRWFDLESEDNRNIDDCINRINLMKANEQTALSVYVELQKEINNLYVIPVGLSEDALKNTKRKWEGNYAQSACYHWIHMIVAEWIWRLSIGQSKPNGNFWGIVADPTDKIPDFSVCISKDEGKNIKFSNLLIMNKELILFASTKDKKRAQIESSKFLCFTPPELKYIDNVKVNNDIANRKNQILDEKIKNYKGELCSNLKKSVENKIDESIWNKYFEYCKNKKSIDIIEYLKLNYGKITEEITNSSRYFLPSLLDNEQAHRPGKPGELAEISSEKISKLYNIQSTIPSARAERRALPNWYKEVLSSESVINEFGKNFFTIYDEILENRFKEQENKDTVNKYIFSWFMLIVDHLMGYSIIEDKNIVTDNKFFKKDSWKVMDEEIRYLIKDRKTNEYLGYTDPFCFFIPSEKFIESLNGSKNKYQTIDLSRAINFISELFIINDKRWKSYFANENPPVWYESIVRITEFIKRNERFQQQVSPVDPDDELVCFPISKNIKGNIDKDFKWFRAFRESNREHQHVSKAIYHIINQIYERQSIDYENYEKEASNDSIIKKIIKAIQEKIKVLPRYNTEIQYILRKDFKDYEIFEEDKVIIIIPKENDKYEIKISKEKIKIFEDDKFVKSEISSEKILGRVVKDNGEEKIEPLTYGHKIDYYQMLKDSDYMLKNKEQYVQKYNKSNIDVPPGVEENLPVVMSIYPNFCYEGFKNYYFRYYVSKDYKDIDKWSLKILVRIDINKEDKPEFILSDEIPLEECDNVSIYEKVIKKYIKIANENDSDKYKDDKYKEALYIPWFVEFIKTEEDGKKKSYGVHPLYIHIISKQYRTMGEAVTVGIDFGTSNTMAGIARDNDMFFNIINPETERVIFSNVLNNDEKYSRVNAAKDSLWVLPYYDNSEVSILPSILAIDKKDNKKFSLVNNKYRNIDKFNYAKEFKLNDEKLLRRDGISDYAAWGLTLKECKLKYLSLIFENLFINFIYEYNKQKKNNTVFTKIDKLLASLPDRLMISNGEENYKAVLKEVMKEIKDKFNIECKDDDIVIIPESEIALTGSGQREILVLADMGGGTFDLSIRYHIEGGKMDDELLFFDSFHMGGEFIVNQIIKYGKDFIPEIIRKEYNKDFNEIIVDILSKDAPIHHSLYDKQGYNSDEYKRYKKLMDLYFDLILEYLSLQICGFIRKVKQKNLDYNIVRIFLSGRGWLLVPKDTSTYETAKDIKEYIKKRVYDIINNTIKNNYYRDINLNNIDINDMYIIKGKEKLVKDLVKIKNYSRDKREQREHGIIGVGIKVKDITIDKNSYVPYFLKGECENFSDFLKSYIVLSDDIFKLDKIKYILKHTNKDDTTLKMEINKLFSKQTDNINPFSKEENNRIIICGSPLVHLYEVYLTEQIKEKVVDNIISTIK